MFRRIRKIGTLLLAVCICGTSQPVFASGLAGGAGLLDVYYSGQEDAVTATSGQDAEETAIEETSEEETAQKEADTEETPQTEAEAPEAGAEETTANTEETDAETEENEAAEETAAGTAAEDEEVWDEEEESEEEVMDAHTAAKVEALNGYDNLGIVSVSGNYLNVRESASSSASIIGRMLNHSACEILDSDGDWYHISSGSVEGYVAKEYILTEEEGTAAALAAMTLKVQITTDTLNVRTEPSTDARVWTQVDISDRYTVVNDLGDWIEIELDEDSTGYVSADYVQLKYTLDTAVAVEVTEEEEETSLRQQIVAYAMQFLGNPYVWGGESLTNGCDCSGFTMLVYRKFGVSLSHYSVSQAGEGRRISSDSMQPGDLIFYAGSSGTINHVTMYIGNGQVIGAQSTRAGIAIRSWNYRTPVKIVNVLD